MKFEWDGAKSKANREKHGIDFETAKDLWLDEDRIDIEAPHPVEKRKIIIAKLHGRLWTAVYTMRSSAIRMISVRHSREKEEKLYGKAKTG
ncbi:MAG: BrnT family toxin [Nitrospirae bacterium]|nr:MAG: BrnT family toxin [Nitrospirota bacterium]